MSRRWLFPFAVNPHRVPAYLTRREIPGAGFVILRDVVPVLMESYLLATVLTWFMVPFCRLKFATLLVGGWRIIPLAMNLHGVAPDVTRFVIPRAFLVVIRNVVPILMVPYLFPAVLAWFFVPLCCLKFATLFMSGWWVIPLPMNLHRVATYVACQIVPGTFLMVVGYVVPVFVVLD
jgi:hypothetical protein